MSRMNIVVVESPAKAKTINKYLGRDYKVVASYGHIRDLPAKDGSVLPDADFAMSWEVDVKPVVFNEVTRNAVLDAFRHPREIDGELVEAYLARRALDYLVGFTLSPVLWRKLPGSRSAGRVQSVALRLVCEREAEIEAFKPREYWSIEVTFRTQAGQVFTARLTHLDGKKLDKFTLGTEADARA